MSFKKKSILSRVTAGLAAVAMTVTMVPLGAVAEGSSSSINGEDVISNMAVMPMLPTDSMGATLMTGLGRLEMKWSYSKSKAPAPFKNSKQVYNDYTVKVKTKGGQERKPWDYMTTSQRSSDYPDQPFPFTFDATDTGDTKMMTWLPVLGTEDGQRIVDTALALLRHKVDGSGEEVTFDQLIEKISETFEKVPLPAYVETPQADSFKTVDSEEQQKLINAIDPPLERFITEHQENGTPVNELTLTENEENKILDTVTDIMGLGGMQPTSGVREGDTITMSLDSVEIKNENNEFGSVNTIGLVPIEFVVDPKNNEKFIQNEDDHTAKIPTGAELVYNGEVQTGVESGAGYTLSGTYSAANAGNYTATATLAEGYTWSDSTTAAKTINWKINPASIVSVNYNNDEFTYSGTNIKQYYAIATDPAGLSMAENTDYTATYTGGNFVNVGSYTVTVTGKGNFTGTASASCKIVPDEISGAELTATAYDYDGTVKRPQVRSVTGKNATPTFNDFTITFSDENSTEPGEYTVTVTGKNNFTGSASAKYTINETRKELDKADPVYPDGKDENSEYTKKEAEEVGLRDESGSELKKGEDYTQTVSVKTGDENKWVVEYEPIDGKSKDKKTIELIRACEHEGTGRTYEKKDENQHKVYCAKDGCKAYLGDEEHTFERKSDGTNVWEECRFCHQTRETTLMVTVNYSVASGLKTPEDFVPKKEQTGLKAGDSFSIPSPKYKGLKPSEVTVIGNIGTSDMTIEVTYTECTHDKWHVTDFIKPTCEEDSKVVLTECDICGKEDALTAAQIHALGDPYVATGHNFEEGDWRREAKLNKKPGSGHYHKCLNSGCYVTEREPHVWSGEQTSGTKCGVDFVITDECSVCGTQYEYRPAECKLVRAPELDVPPTCEEYGFEKYKCTVCGSIASDAIPPLNHDYQTIEYKDATCTEKEYTKKECTHCHDIIEEYGKYRSENGQHNYVKHWVHQLTCTEDGESDGEFCSICNQKNPDSKEEYFEHKGHKVKAWVQKEGKVKNGFTKQGTPIELTNYTSVHECEKCGAVLGMEEWTVATCTKPSKLEIASGKNAEIDDISGGIHILGNMANDGGVTFNENVLHEVTEFVNDDKISSKYVYKKTKTHSYLIEFSPYFLAEIEDGTYPVEIVNGHEFVPLMVTVKDHKPVGLSDQEYPEAPEITKKQLDAKLEKAEKDGAVIRNLFVYPLTEEELDGMTFPESPADEPSHGTVTGSSPAPGSSGSSGGGSPHWRGSRPTVSGTPGNSGSGSGGTSAPSDTGSAPELQNSSPIAATGGDNPDTGSAAPKLYGILLLAGALLIAKKRKS